MKAFVMIFVFLLVCAMGTIVGLASGTQWGTDGCGALTFATFACACIIGALAPTLME